MATIKTYPDIEQSKKLAEILPLESADMIYRPIMYIDSMSNNGFLNEPECYPFNDFKNNINKPLPCWSLSALLNVLPSATLDSSDDHHYRVHCIGRYSEWYGNAIDACYEVIIKLHELKML